MNDENNDNDLERKNNIDSLKAILTSSLGSSVKSLGGLA